MSKEHDSTRYPRMVGAQTNKYIQELLAEVDRLQKLTVSLEEERSTAIEENSRLRGRNRELESRLEAFETERKRLHERLQGIEQKNDAVQNSYADVTSRLDNLMTLYVASFRLHSTLSREGVLEAVHEIIINLLGSEDFAIFETSRENHTLKLTTSFGIEPDDTAKLDPSQGPIADAFTSGQIYVADGKAETSLEAPLACVPLRFDEEIAGVVVLFGLLEHKSSLEDVDQELLELLARQAGTALWASRLHEPEVVPV